MAAKPNTLKSCRLVECRQCPKPITMSQFLICTLVFVCSFIQRKCLIHHLLSDNAESAKYKNGEWLKLLVTRCQVPFLV